MIEFVVPFVLVLLAVILLVAEDLLPTGGALGILSVACLGLLLYLGFSNSMEAGWRYLAMEVVLVPAGFWAWSILMSRTKLGQFAALRPPEAHEVDLADERANLSHLVGQTGRALTALRPSGMVDFEGRRLDGVAEEGLIPPGTRLTAVAVRSGRLIVRATPEGPEPRGG